MKCHDYRCAKEAHFVVTTKDDFRVYCLKHARIVFQGDCVYYDKKNAVTGIWRINEMPSWLSRSQVC